MKLTIVVENTVAMPFKPGIVPGLFGEHGLCVMIENGQGRWLYDTGRGKALMPNLQSLGVEPDSIDGVILSHGHLDHVSGLIKLLQARKNKLPVYCHEAVFLERYNKVGDKLKPVGMSWTQSELESLGAEFHFNKEAAEIAPNMWMSGEINERHPLETIKEPFFVKCADQLMPDTIPDEQALILKTEEGLIVLTGCAHSGIVSILNKTDALFPGETVRAVLGGLHLCNAGPERLKLTIDELHRRNAEIVAVGHCTGFHETSAIAQELGERFQGMNAGTSFLF